MKRLLAVFLFAAFLPATTVKPMSIEDLAAAASVIVSGQAMESWSTWNAQHTLIYTFTKFAVARHLKGSPDQTLTIKQLGGTAGGYTQKVAGVHPMRSGDSAVLFLRPSEARDGTMVIVGLMQGNFRIERDARTGTTIVSNGVADVHASNSTGVTDYKGSKLTLRQLESRIRKVAQ